LQLDFRQATDGNLFRLFQQARFAGSGFKVRRGQTVRHTGLPGEFLAGLHNPPQKRKQRFLVEIDVGDGCKQTLYAQPVRCRDNHAFRPGVERRKGKSAQTVDDQILKRSRFRLFSAHARFTTSRSGQGLLALIAKHDILLAFVVMMARR
jgi:hypothetical protein